MRKKLIVCAFFILIILFGIGCVDPEYVGSGNVDSNYIQPTYYSPEMQTLKDFLKEDITDELSYSPDIHRGADYLVCTGFSRDLAKNAREYGILMGAISLRDTMKVGEGTRYYHAMNYCIIDGKFILIEPQTDEVLTLESLKDSDYSVYKYISIYQDAQMMTNFGRGRETIDIDIYGGYDESEIIKKFPPK
ncbi:MAG: hypothetical protein M8352_02045 [ANME-2 cluster archaeon]|nr:hypothetical protein [ANME-2 cluster archaeon]MDF1531326.1 hypothetical protein [ANME-2 cluster archaeon]